MSKVSGCDLRNSLIEVTVIQITFMRESHNILAIVNDYVICDFSYINIFFCSRYEHRLSFANYYCISKILKKRQGTKKDWLHTSFGSPKGLPMHLWNLTSIHCSNQLWYKYSKSSDFTANYHCMWHTRWPFHHIKQTEFLFPEAVIIHCGLWPKQS